MQFELKLEPNPVGISTEIFETRVEGQMREYLQNTCILDPNGINRVIPLLRKTFISSCNGLMAGLSVEPLELGPLDENGDPAPEKIEWVKTQTHALGDKVSEILFEQHIQMMLSMAKTLADHDERVYKRLRH